ncbi:MAG: hypothetical protein KIT33_12915 [Candidatus Kapabacteria bacterium]|nr:hypothetical protein [Ignavibacteriota bacterium]MCW5885863.1 hypothetical protein [Candidatus Kapabacteria bacterium]
MKVLLSIKPEFAFKIFDGTKKFEYRRSIFKNKRVKSIIVYASSPVQQVIGEFEIDEILNFDIDTLWHLTHEYSGVSEDFYYRYFSDKERGFAIKIKKFFKYKNPKCLKAEFNMAPPQSFSYIDDN